MAQQAINQPSTDHNPGPQFQQQSDRGPALFAKHSYSHTHITGSSYSCCSNVYTRASRNIGPCSHGLACVLQRCGISTVAAGSTAAKQREQHVPLQLDMIPMGTPRCQ